MGRQPSIDVVEVTKSALKHGIDEADIAHAWTNAIRLVEYEYEGEDRLLVIGRTDTVGCWSLSPCQPANPPGSSTPTGSDPSSSTS